MGLDEALEIFEDELLGCNSMASNERCGTPEGISCEHWRIIQAASSRSQELTDGELLHDFGDSVDGLWLLVRGGLAAQVYAAGSDTERIVKTSAKYTAPFVTGTSPYFLNARHHAFRTCGDGKHGAMVLLLSRSDLERLETQQPAVHASLQKHLAGHSLAVEGIHQRW